MPKRLTKGDLAAFQCIDCDVSTFHNHEYYMVHDHIWLSVVERIDSGMLCIGCLEGRLGRRLTPADFTDAPVNAPEFFRQSSRLADRLGRPQKEAA